MQFQMAEQIVQAALALRRSHAHAPPQEVLDLVMQGSAGHLLDFGTHMVPPDPFAVLVAQAMGDPMTPDEWLAHTGPEADARVRSALRLQFALNVWPLFLERYRVG
jgi:hypothetical protein